MGMILPKMLEILAILWFSEFFYRKIQKFFGAWDLKKRHEIKSGYNFFKATGKVGWSSLGGVVLCITGTDTTDFMKDLYCSSVVGILVL